MSPHQYRVVCVGGSFPRVSGDEPTLNSDKVAGALFSPRERG